MQGALALDFLGLNVTVPYKSDVIPYLAEIDPLAERIGAVNTLVRCQGDTRAIIQTCLDCTGPCSRTAWRLPGGMW